MSLVVREDLSKRTALSKSVLASFDMTLDELLAAYARIWTKIDAGDCWEWRGARHKKTGYGHVKVGGRTATIHRVVWELLVEPVPVGLELDHLCSNRGCVNPDHLEPVTRRVNILRSQCIPARRARMVTCEAGHPKTEPTGYRNRRGAWICRVCRRAADRRRPWRPSWRQRQKAAA